MAKFFRRGKSKIYFVPTVAAPSTGPTSAELTAGQDLSPLVADIAGFQLSNSPISTPNLADQFTPQIDGEDTVADSSLTLYDDDAASAIRTALAKGTVGYICLLPYGNVTAKRAEVWAVKTTGANDEWSTGNDAARFVVGFAVTAVPKQNATVQ